MNQMKKLYEYPLVLRIALMLCIVAIVLGIWTGTFLFVRDIVEHMCEPQTIITANPNL